MPPGAIVGTGALGARCCSRSAPGGSAAGWAFQLQDPRTILLLLLLAIAITLNLLGLFELPVLGGRARPTRRLRTGALAAFVATPCAGPFLGAALGTALLLPPAGRVLVFAALGLGLAHAVRRWSPSFPRCAGGCRKPGPWMARLQRFLAIPMAATAVGCLWLLWRQGGRTALLVGLVAAVAAGRCLPGRRGASAARGRASALAGDRALSRSSVAAGRRRCRSARRSPRARPPGAEPWSEAAVAARLRQGRPVFVYFTADWCLTCKANEVAAIDRDEVRDAFRKAGVRGAGRRLDQRRPGDHPLPRKPRPRRRAALSVVRARAARPRNCRRC